MAEGLLERIAAGDQTAVKECMDAYGNLIWSLARRFCASAADAEDATQEIFLEIWKFAARYDPTAGSEAVFISTIARRRMIDRLRARDRRPPMQPLDDLLDVQEASAETDAGALAVDAALASRAVAQLDPLQQQVLLMGVVQGMTHAEIAESTGKPLGTVKTQIRRGLLRVRELLEQDSGRPSQKSTR